MDLNFGRASTGTQRTIEFPDICISFLKT